VLLCIGENEEHPIGHPTPRGLPFHLQSDTNERSIFRLSKPSSQDRSPRLTLKKNFKPIFFSLFFACCFTPEKTVHSPNDLTNVVLAEYCPVFPTFCLTSPDFCPLITKRKRLPKPIPNHKLACWVSLKSPNSTDLFFFKSLEKFPRFLIMDILKMFVISEKGIGKTKRQENQKCLLHI